MTDLQSLQTAETGKTEYTDAKDHVHTVTNSLLLDTGGTMYTKEQIMEALYEILGASA